VVQKSNGGHPLFPPAAISDQRPGARGQSAVNPAFSSSTDNCMGLTRLAGMGEKTAGRLLTFFFRSFHCLLIMLLQSVSKACQMGNV